MGTLDMDLRIRKISYDRINRTCTWFLGQRPKGAGIEICLIQFDKAAWDTKGKLMYHIWAKPLGDHNISLWKTIEGFPTEVEYEHAE